MPRKTKTKPVRGRDSLQIANPDTEWFDDRLDLVGLNRLGLSVEYDPSSKNWFNKILKGERRCQLGEVAWIAERLGVSGAEVIRRLGHVLPAGTVNIIGTVNADSRVSMWSPAKYEVVAAPPDARPSTVALRIETVQTILSLYAGTLLYYTPAAAVHPGAFGHVAVLEAGDQRAPLVGTLDRGGISKARIILLDGRTVIETSQLLTAAPVEWTKST